jgi:hypothetical protein
MGTIIKFIGKNIIVLTLAATTCYVNYTHKKSIEFNTESVIYNMETSSQLIENQLEIVKYLVDKKNDTIK